MNKRKQVVMVDDDSDYVGLVAKAIHSCDANCLFDTFCNGADLMNWLEKHPNPSLILLNTDMAVTSGFQVLQTLKKLDAYKAIPIIMLTKSKRKEDVERSYDQGANAYMVKPPVFDELLACISMLNYYWFDVARTPE